MANRSARKKKSKKLTKNSLKVPSEQEKEDRAHPPIRESYAGRLLIISGIFASMISVFSHFAYGPLVIASGFLAVATAIVGAFIVGAASHRRFYGLVSLALIAAVFTWIFYANSQKKATQNVAPPVTIITSERSPLSSPTPAPIAAPQQSNAAGRAHEQIKQAPATTPVLNADADDSPPAFVWGGTYNELMNEKVTGALVVAQNEKTQRIYQSVSDFEGRFSFSVPHGEYSVTVTHPKYAKTVMHCNTHKSPNCGFEFLALQKIAQ